MIEYIIGACCAVVLIGISIVYNKVKKRIKIHCHEYNVDYS